MSPDPQIENLSLESLSHDQLQQLNSRIVDRLRRMESLASSQMILDLVIGQRVRIDDPRYQNRVGTVVKKNKTTVDLKFDDCRRQVRASAAHVIPVQDYENRKLVHLADYR